jgi:hypothetical protein
MLFRVELERILSQCEIARRIDDVDRDRALRDRRALRPCDGSGADSGERGRCGAGNC